MSDPLVSPRILFRFSAPCLHRAPPLWTVKGIQLGEEHALPVLAELDDCPRFADVRVGWHETGLAFNVRVQGKRQQPWCRDSQMDASDGLHLWIDTRDTHNIHRAGRFCHRFAFLPMGAGGRRDDPVVGQLFINRAREHARPADANYLKVRAEKRVDGYVLEAWIAAGALTGYDPKDNPKLGFHYAVIDRELGNQTFSVGDEFPHEEDPSLWGTLELIVQRGT
jgi:hypothetical protein